MRERTKAMAVIFAGALAAMAMPIPGQTADGTYEEPPTMAQTTPLSCNLTGAVQQDEPTEPVYGPSTAEMLAKTVWGEARGCSEEEQRLVVWTVFQRVDDGRFGDTVEEVVTAPRQFDGYGEDYPVEPGIYALCEEEMGKWLEGGTAPVLEPYATELPYLFFEGKNGHNWFRKEWR